MGCGSSTQTPVKSFNGNRDSPQTKSSSNPFEKEEKENVPKKKSQNVIKEELRSSSKSLLKEKNVNISNEAPEKVINEIPEISQRHISNDRNHSSIVKNVYNIPGSVPKESSESSIETANNVSVIKEEQPKMYVETPKTSDDIPPDETPPDGRTPDKTTPEAPVVAAKESTDGNVTFDKKCCRIKSKTQPLVKRDKITIIHFNDVYNIEPRDQEPVGGAARFITKVRSFPNEPLILFSGDCLNPSLMSTVTKGKQMIPALNKIGVHAAVYGNHDFDFGVDELLEFKSKTNFPWLMSNVHDKLTKTFLADGIEKVVATWHGRKIGIIGLIEKEWLATLATIDPEDVEYIDFIERARDLVRDLRDNEGCELIIALTHMRVPNDLKLLESDVPIDLVLGGHDHHYETKEHEGRVFVKSGTDFREFTEIEVDFNVDENERKKITTVHHEITSELDEDDEMKQECEKYELVLGGKMEEVLGVMQVELDGRFSTVRTKESNLGNFVCDIMRAAVQTDIAILNSGSLRSDTIHPPGPFKMKDLVTILPMVDCLVVLKIKGSILLEVLENAVSQYPKFEGRFLQVSGVKFTFDPDKPPGERVLHDSVKVHENIPLEIEKEYSVVMKEYMARGKDGYDMLDQCEVLVDSENSPVLPTIVENHFQSIKIYKGRRRSISGHRQSITVKHDEVQSFMEDHRSKLSPMVEGRIAKVGDEEVKLPPSYIRRKSKLRVRKSTIRSTGSSLSEVKEGGDETGQDSLQEMSVIEKMVIEEIEGDDSDIDSVMESDESREPINDEDRMRIWEACTNDDLEMVKDIVAARTLDFKFWIMEKTLLHHTTHHSAMKCLEYLIKETNLKVDVRDQILKSTSLYYAAEEGATGAANLLLENGAKVNAKNALWDTPLHAACENQRGDVIILLLSRGADRTSKNKDGERPKI